MHFESWVCSPSILYLETCIMGLKVRRSDCGAKCNNEIECLTLSR